MKLNTYMNSIKNEKYLRRQGVKVHFVDENMFLFCLQKHG